MNARRAISFIALTLPLLAVASASCPAEDGPPKRYATPKDVFEAYREARVKQDARACFLLLSRVKQDDAVYEAYFECLIKDSKETNAVLERHGVDMATLTRDLKREFKEKHGVEPADDEAVFTALDKDYEKEHGTPPADRRVVMSDVLRRRIKDKVGFFLEVEGLRRNQPISPLGELERVVIEGDRATGRAARTLPVARGQVPGSLGTYDREYRFRKVDGGWLLDTW